MKIKFEHEGKVVATINSLSDIYLSAYNPRIETIPSMKKDLILFISKKSKKTNNEIFLDLLEHEGDLNDLMRLFESIDEKGFDSSIEYILLVKAKRGKKDIFVVAEGNRRIMCLKILNKDSEFTFPPYEEIFTRNYVNVDNKKTFGKKLKANYKKIVDKIEKIKKEQKEFTVNFEIIEDNIKLWRMIYTKHIAGVRPGMREWSRGKYFCDILNFFPNGYDGSRASKNNLRDKLQREPSRILEDFKNAQFVMKVIEAGEERWTKDKIFKKMLKLKVSAFEPNFSLRYFREVALEYLNIDLEHFEKYYFKHSYEQQTNLIKFHDDDHKIIHHKKILKFLYEQCSNGILTTRPVAAENIENFTFDVKNLLNFRNIEDIKNKEDFDKIEGLDYTIDGLKKIIDKCKKMNIDVPKRFLVYLQMKENKKKRNLKIREINIKKLTVVQSSKFNDLQPKDVFTELHNQFNHNTSSKFYFMNAAAISIRSIIEQYIIWTAYYCDDIIEKFYDKYYKNDKSKSIEEWRKFYVQIIIRKWDDKYKKNKIYVHSIVKWIKEILNNSKNRNTKNKFISKILNENNEIFNKMEKIISDDFLDDLVILNEFIHASHRLYVKKTFNIYLEKLKKWDEIITTIIVNLNVNQLSKMNDQMLNEIKELNK